MQNEIFNGLLSSSRTNLNFAQFLLSLVLSGISGALIGLAYQRFGRALSDRRTISMTVIYLAIITTFVISVVQSSVALSLGLVGSLSIVRFRTPVKEPEELLVLFAAIAIGLGYGAGEYLMTFGGLGLFLVTMILLNLRKRTPGSKILSLTIEIPNGSLKMNQIIETLEKACRRIEIIRSDEKTGSQAMTFHLVPMSFDLLEEAKAELKKLNPQLTWSFIEFRPLG